MQNKIVFGNIKYNKKLEIGHACELKLLANIGHMDDRSNFEDEIKKQKLPSNLVLIFWLTIPSQKKAFILRAG